MRFTGERSPPSLTPVSASAPMIRTLTYRLLQIATLLTFGASLWVAGQHPLAAPFVERTDAAAERALARALAWRVTPLWVDTELRAALADRDYDRLGLILDLANERGVGADPMLLSQIAAFAAEAERPSAALAACARCAYDIAACRSVADIAACAVPVELSPLGDLNALRRAGVDAAAGREVDRFEAGLALVGLAATGMAPASGGASLTVKAGASLLRLARRMGAITPPLLRTLHDITDIPVDWGRLPSVLSGQSALHEVTDVAKLDRLSGFAGDVGRIRDATSSADTLVLLRYIDTSDDARSLARVAEIEGDGTRATMFALGKSRAFRTLNRLSRLALTALTIWSAAFGLMLALISETLRRALRPRKSRVA